MILLNLGDYVGVINVDEVKRARNIGWNKRFVAEDLLLAFWLTCETPVGSWKCMCSKPTCLFFLWARKRKKFYLGPPNHIFIKFPQKNPFKWTWPRSIRMRLKKKKKTRAWSCFDYFSVWSLSEPLQEFDPQQLLIALLIKGGKKWNELLSGS